MMICKADFEELFPDLFTTVKHRRTEEPNVQIDPCIDRWKDDGGSVYTQPPTNPGLRIHKQIT